MGKPATRGHVLPPGLGSQTAFGRSSDMVWSAGSRSSPALRSGPPSQTLDHRSSTALYGRAGKQLADSASDPVPHGIRCMQEQRQSRPSIPRSPSKALSTASTQRMGCTSSPMEPGMLESRSTGTTTGRQASTLKPTPLVRACAILSKGCTCPLDRACPAPLQSYVHTAPAHTKRLVQARDLPPLCASARISAAARPGLLSNCPPQAGQASVTSQDCTRSAVSWQGCSMMPKLPTGPVQAPGGQACAAVHQLQAARGQAGLRCRQGFCWALGSSGVPRAARHAD